MREALGTLVVMFLTLAPSLVYVIGLPAGLLMGSLLVGGAVFMLIGRSRRS